MLTALREAVAFFQVAHENPMVQRLRTWRRSWGERLCFVVCLLLILFGVLADLQFHDELWRFSLMVPRVDFLLPVLSIMVLAYRPRDRETLEQLLLVPGRETSWFLAAHYWPVTLIFGHLLLGQVATLGSFLIYDDRPIGAILLNSLLLLIYRALSCILVTASAIRTNIRHTGFKRIFFLITRSYLAYFALSHVATPFLLAANDIIRIIHAGSGVVDFSIMRNIHTPLMAILLLIPLGLAILRFNLRLKEAPLLYYRSVREDEVMERLPGARFELLNGMTTVAWRLHREVLVRTTLLVVPAFVIALASIAVLFLPQMLVTKEPERSALVSFPRYPEAYLLPLFTTLLLFLLTNPSLARPVPVVSGYVLHRILPVFFVGALIAPATCLLYFAWEDLFATPNFWSPAYRLVSALLAPIFPLLVISAFPRLRLPAYLFAGLYLLVSLRIRSITLSLANWESLVITGNAILCVCGFFLSPVIVQRLHDTSVLSTPLGEVGTASDGTQDDLRSATT